MEQKTVFVVLEDNVRGNDQSRKMFVFSSKEKAIVKKNELIEQSGIRKEIEELYQYGDIYICQEDEMSFEAYLDGRYDEDHYEVSVNEAEMN